DNGKLLAALVQPAREVEEQPHAGAVEVRDVGEVEHDPLRAAGDRPDDALARAPGVLEVDLAVDRQHDLAVEALRVQLGVGHSRHRRMTTVPSSSWRTSTLSLNARMSFRPRPRRSGAGSRQRPSSRTRSSSTPAARLALSQISASFGP